MSRSGAEIQSNEENQKDRAQDFLAASLKSIRPPSVPGWFESQSKFIQERVAAVEKNFGHLCETLSSYTRKTARIRDKGDQLSKDLISYTESDNLNPSSKRNLTELAHTVSSIQDYRQAQVTRLEAKVVQPLSNYGLKCKHTKADLKAAFTARDKESKLRKKFESARAKGDQRNIQQLETQLQKATVDASRTSRNLEQQMDKFELEKLKDIKKILTEFVNIEMIFHAKALEMYTECFQVLTALDVDEDIQEFRAKMQPADSAKRMTIARSVSSSSLNSNQPSFNNTPRNERRNTVPKRSMQNGGVGDMDDDDDDDDDDDEEEEEEEEDEEEDEEEEETELETERSETVQKKTPVRR